MVMVYLLGHCVGDIKEPVLYVHHDVYDYDGHSRGRHILLHSGVNKPVFGNIDGAGEYLGGHIGDEGDGPGLGDIVPRRAVYRVV